MAVSGVPRMAPTVIRRARLEDWLARFAGTPARILVGPGGWGKTTAILSYLTNTPSTGFYCSLPQDASADCVRTAIARAMQHKSPEISHEALIRILCESAPAEVAIDCADAASPDGIAEIHRIIEELPEDVSLLLACRSRTAIDVSGLIARGLATLCDVERLAFDASEIRYMAESCGVSATHEAVVKLLENTDGWPLVVSGAIRHAAEDGRDLSDAFGLWRSRQGHLFSEFVNVALESAAPQKAQLVHQLMNGIVCDDQQLLHALEVEGLFVIHGPRGYRPLRALARGRLRAQVEPDGYRMPPMHVQLLGRFHAEIDAHPIPWIRRRDAHIFKYLALKRTGSATRAELAEMFWPGAETHLVAQSLRTALSNIRKAIGIVAGFDLVDVYFHATGDISLDLDNVIVDVSRFLAHANDGDAQYVRNELRPALAHYRSAVHAYAGNLLTGESAETWFEAQAAMLADRHIIIVKRLIEITRELGDDGAYVHYAELLTELRPADETARAALAEAMRVARLHGLALVRPAAEAAVSSIIAAGKS
jgi:DNA-binding SARP family transcriptional activator